MNLPVVEKVTLPSASLTVAGWTDLVAGVLEIIGSNPAED